MLRWRTRRPERVRLELRQPGSILAQLADGTAKLAIGAAAEIRPEPGNPIGAGALAVYVGNDKAGYLPTGSYLLVEPGDATVEAAAGATGAAWQLVCAPKQWKVLGVDKAIEMGCRFEAALAEVKSENDQLWTEQKIWINALNYPQVLSYGSPYLVDGEGRPTVRSVHGASRLGRSEVGGRGEAAEEAAQKEAEASTSKQPMGTDADFADEPPRPKAKAKKEAPPKKAAAKKRDDQAKPAAKRKAKVKDEGGEKKRKGKELAAPQEAPQGGSRVAGGARPCGLRLGRRRREEAQRRAAAAAARLRLGRRLR